MGNNVSQSDQGDASAVDGVAVNLPPFTPTDPERWFEVVERTFEKAGVNDETKKYNYICRALEEHDAEELKDFLINWPTDRPYATLKTELVGRNMGTATPQESETPRFQLDGMGDENLTRILQHLLIDEEKDKVPKDSESVRKINEISNSMIKVMTVGAADSSQASGGEPITSDTHAESDEKITVDCEKALARCVVCNNNVEVDDDADDDDGPSNINGKVTNAICSIVQTLNKTRTRYSTVCKSCYKTLNEVDEMESTLTSITMDICSLYKKSARFSDKDLHEVRDENEEDCSDRESLDDIQSMQVEPTVKNEKVKKLRKNANVNNIQSKLMQSKDGCDKEIDDQKFGMQKSFKQFTGRYACIVCKGPNKESRNTKGIIAHFKDEHDLCLYFCDTCGDFFREKQDLPHNLYDFATKEEIQYMCEECILQFNNHYAYLNDPQYVPWPCKTCGKCFNSKISLEKHKKKHSKSDA